MPPDDSEVTLTSLAISLARMEGKLNQIVIDHERRLNALDKEVDVVHDRITTSAKTINEQGARLNSLGDSVKDLHQKSTGLLGRAMTVIAPVVAIAAFLFTVYQSLEP